VDSVYGCKAVSSRAPPRITKKRRERLWGPSFYCPEELPSPASSRSSSASSAIFTSTASASHRRWAQGRRGSFVPVAAPPRAPPSSSSWQEEFQAHLPVTDGLRQQLRALPAVALAHRGLLLHLRSAEETGRTTINC
jgi:hypothetical protein